MEMLHQWGCSINSRTSYQDLSAVDIAVIQNQTKIVKFLVENGCEINKKPTDSDQSPIEVAIEFSSEEIVDLLLNRKDTVQSRGIFTSPLTPADDFSEPPRNHAHLSAYNPTAEYFNPAADCGGSAEDPPVTCIIPPRVCGGFPMKSNDVIMIDRYGYLTHLVI